MVVKLPTVFVDRGDLQNRNAQPILRQLVYVALTRATSVAVGAV